MKTKTTLPWMAGVIILLMSWPALAQEITIGGELRPRFEYRHGYKSLFPDGADPATFVSQRTRLNAFYAQDGIKVKLVLQDVRVWGDVAQLNVSDKNGTAIHEAWGSFTITRGLSLKAGRQEFVYDNSRILGNVGWAQQARSHDAALFTYTGGKHRVDLALAYNAMGESLVKTDYTLANYKSMQFLWYHGQWEHVGISFLILNNGMEYQIDSVTRDVVYSQTIGTFVNGKQDRLSWSVSAYYQGGKDADNRDLKAWYAAADLHFNMTDQFTAGIGAEVLSGTATSDQVAGSTDQSFTPLYGTNHKFNGWMDYFYVGSYNGSNGLMDIYLPLQYKKDKLTLQAIPHMFRAAATVSATTAQGTTDYNSGLGTEIDLMASWAVSKVLNLSAGYSQLWATETMQALKGGNYKNTNNWGWIMLTFKPVFYDHSAAADY